MQYPDGMSERAATQADLHALKALQTDASEIERIENLLDRLITFLGLDILLLAG